MSKLKGTPIPEDFIGGSYSYLTILAECESVKRYRGYVVRCVCGKVFKEAGRLILRGARKSCGCRWHEMQGDGKRVHGATGTPTWMSWAKMRVRCANNPKSRWHKWYAARGITICARWDNYDNFLSDMGERPSGMTLDRMDNNKGYEPGNCRWATSRQQMRNTRQNRMIKIGDESLSMSEWCDRTGINAAAVSARINKLGWPEEKALFTPIGAKKDAR